MINDIKAKLPSKKKAKSEIDEEELSEEESTDPSISASDKTSSTDISHLADDFEDENDGQTKSIIDKLRAKLIPKKSAGPAKKNEKKKLNPVVLIVVVVAGIGVLFLPDESDVDLDTQVQTPPPKRILKRPVTPPKPEEGAAANPNPEAATETPTEAIAETPVEVAPEVVTETPDAVVSETPTDVPVIDAPVAEDPVIDPIVSDAEPILDEPVVTDVPSPDTSIAPVSEDTVDGQVSADETSMTDKILEDLEKQVKKDQPKTAKTEYVSPPDYEYKGRGLVYNCTGKHWACVDGPSFKTCEDNFSSSTFKKKSIECYPFNVYETTKGCEAMQNRVVSSNAKTEFCKGN